MSNPELEQLKPPLKWAGGKRWLVPHLKPIWQAYSSARLVEPFCGGLAVTLGLLPETALLNDINPHLINFYRWLKAGLTIDFGMANDQTAYYERRAQFNQLIQAGEADSREAAGLFYYLNRTCYNGLCRFNRSGGFNVPFGKYKTINYETDFRQYMPLLARWEIINTDFENLPLKHGDFIYADPPYDVEFTSYSKEGFGWQDQVRLAEWLARYPGPVALSNQATARITDLYRQLGFNLVFLNAPRMINSTGDRTPAREVLAFKSINL